MLSARKSNRIFVAAAAASLVIHKKLKRESAICQALHHHVVIIGGGTAGVGVSSQLLKEEVKDIAVIEPRSSHFYQPLWTLVGGGIKKNSDSVMPIREVLAKQTTLIPQFVAEIKPNANEIILADGVVISYDYLVIATGLQTRWDLVPGLREAIKDPASKVVSIYGFDSSAKTWTEIQAFRGGRALFTMPNSPIKCAGAPQKIMWLFEEYTRDKDIRDKTSVEFWIPSQSMFGVPKYSKKLETIRVARFVDAFFQQELVSIDSENHIATFKSLKEGDKKPVFTKEKYDLLHVSPPFSAQTFLITSNKQLPTDKPLTDAHGFVSVNKCTLQSDHYPNVFALGDCCNTPNSKTAAAVMAQAPVVVHNLRQKMNSQPLNGAYNGYGSCPLMIGKNKVILAEFGYDGSILETFNHHTGVFPFSLLGQDGPIQERLFAFTKKHIFPFVYWHLYSIGRWYGPYTIFKPDVTKKHEPKTEPEPEHPPKRV